MPDTWTPPASDKVQTGWTPPASDRVASAPSADLLSHGVPDGPRYGMNDDQILKASGFSDDQIKTIKASKSYKPGAFAGLMSDPNSIATQIRRDPSVAPVMVALNGLGTPISGGLQAISHLAGALGGKSQEDVALDDAFRRVRELNFKQNVLPGAYYNSDGSTPLATKVADLAGQIVPFMAGGLESKGVQAGRPLVTRVLQGMARGAAEGATFGAVQPVDPTKGGYMEQKVPQVAGGAVGGGVLGGAVPAGGAMLNMLRPGFNSKAAQIMAETESLGVNLKPSQIQDLVKKNTIPDELIQARAAADAFGSDLRQRVLDTPFSGLEDVKAAASGTGKRANAAQALLEQINNSGTEAQDLVKTSAGLQAFRAKLKADTLFAYRDKLGAALTDIDTPNTIKAIDDAINKLKLDQSGDNTAQVKALEAFRDRLSGPNGAQDHLSVTSPGRPIVIQNGQPIEGPVGTSDHLGLVSGKPVVIRNGVPAEPVRDIYGTIVSPGSNAAPAFERGPGAPQPIVQPSPIFGQGPAPSSEALGNRSFQALSSTRANLGDRISAAYKGNNAVTGSLDASTLQPIKNALESDLQAAAEKSGNPDLIQADRAARDFYAKYSGTFKDPTIIKAITSADPDQVFNAFAKAGPYRAQRIYDALDPKGQAAAASGIFDKALDAGFNKRTGTWIPGNVSGALTDLQSSLGVTLNGSDKVRLDGVRNLMQTLAKLEPENASALGERFAGIAEKAGGKTGIVRTAYDLLKNGGVDLLFDSPKGKQILFGLSQTEPGSPASNALVQKFFTLAGAEKGIPLKVSPAFPAAAQNPNPDDVAQVKP